MVIYMVSKAVRCKLGLSNKMYVYQYTDECMCWNILAMVRLLMSIWLLCVLDKIMVIIISPMFQCKLLSSCIVLWFLNCISHYELCTAVYSYDLSRSLPKSQLLEIVKFLLDSRGYRKNWIHLKVNCVRKFLGTILVQFI